jgi:hypothetical protein
MRSSHAVPFQSDWKKKVDPISWPVVFGSLFYARDSYNLLTPMDLMRFQCAKDRTITHRSAAITCIGKVNQCFFIRLSVRIFCSMSAIFACACAFTPAVLLSGATRKASHSRTSRKQNPNPFARRTKRIHDTASSGYCRYPEAPRMGSAISPSRL